MDYEASMHSLLEGLLQDENAEPTDLPITLLNAITKDFSDDLQIGNGGFAVVYKGLLANGRTVAIKKMYNSIDMHEEKYNQEVGCLLRLKHKNIVRFLGYCADTQGKMCDYGGMFVMADVRHRLLCFEYVPRGSLEQYISGRIIWHLHFHRSTVILKNNLGALFERKILVAAVNRSVSLMKRNGPFYLNYNSMNNATYGIGNYPINDYINKTTEDGSTYPTRPSDGLTWRKRYQIIRGICDGLHYLHEERTVHLDLKPANILLDNDMVPKIADFGLSRCFEENQSRAITLNLAGSLGYLAPEFYRGVVSFELDIYSLGVIITELLTGQKGYAHVDHVLESWEKPLNVPLGEIFLEQVRVCAEIAIECMDADPTKRPVIQHIIYMLNETKSVDESIQDDIGTTPIEQLHLTDRDKVKLETMTRNQSIPQTEACSEFAVLVRVTAPSRCAESLRIPVDLVAVLDASMKDAMIFLIDSLGGDDRLSIVAYNSTDALRCTELIVMSSDQNREEARTKVLQLTVGPCDNMGAAIKEAAQILEHRGAEERRSRVGRIILVLSQPGADSIVEHMSREFPIDTFRLGYGSYREARTMYDISYQTSGVFSYADTDIHSALAQCIGGLTSIAAVDVEIILETVEGATISSIDSGGYEAMIAPEERRSGAIVVHDLYAGEHKNFVVWLSVPEGTTTQIMSVSGCYRNHRISKEGTIKLDGSEVAVLRSPTTTTTASSEQQQQTVCPEVAAELVRLELLKCVSGMKKRNSLSLGTVQESWDTIRASQDWRTAPRSALSSLALEAEEIKKIFYTRSPSFAFMFSWLSSHLWQRATTRGSQSSVSGAFRTTPMEDMIQRLYSAHI